MNQAIGERGILREARDERETREEGRRKNKAPRNKSIVVALPPTPTPTKLILTDGGYVKRTNEKLKTPSITHFFWLPETPTAA